jgi:hypothetical protein
MDKNEPHFVVSYTRSNSIKLCTMAWLLTIIGKIFRDANFVRDLTDCKSYTQ